MNQEIEKLRNRLKNVNPKVTEYRMTVTEAKSLLSEIDRLIQHNVDTQIKPLIVEQPNGIPHTRILDAGGF